MTNITPLRRQYLDIKGRYGDCLLLFRIGDFYEAFDEDAQTLSRELNITLTSKPMGKMGRVPLAGVPHHSLERHLATLINRGFRIAICEQLTDAPVKVGAGRGLMERGVVRIVTPGTILEPALLHSKANNYLAAYITENGFAGIAYADVTTGEFAATELAEEEAEEELQRIGATEVIVPSRMTIAAARVPGTMTRYDETFFDLNLAERTLLEHFDARSLAAFDLAARPLAARAAGALIAYLRDTHTSVHDALTRLVVYDSNDYMTLDAHTLRSLEVIESGTAGATLVGVLDQTCSAMGGRLLRRWLRRPLLDRLEIERRQSHVEWFVENELKRSELRTELEAIHDLERLSARARTGIATPQEVATLGAGLNHIPNVRAILQADTKRFGALLTALPACEHVTALIHRALSESITRKSTSNIIREGFSDELDGLRGLLRDGKKYLAEMEARERARTGIRSLRVGYNKVFGYYIEVTRPNLHLVPEGYTRKQTLAAAERFVTLELKEHESMVVHAEERLDELEKNLFRHVCNEIGKARTEITGAAATLAHLDAIAAFAENAARYAYVCPHVTETDELRITGNRHPVLERTIAEGKFVGNDTELAGNSSEVKNDVPQIALLTGPNMSGKSTYMRAIAITVLLAQAGAFVPATEASIGICDRIWTRTGLYDRIGSGESTFMTEMLETAQILHGATNRSLVLFDELGRGTSTYDGLAVARAVLEYVHNHPRLGCKTLFATHYHELTELEELLPRLRNYHVAIAERDGELEFLYKVLPGSSGRSYGVYAAKLAGLPRPIVRRAEKLLDEYEAKSEVGAVNDSLKSVRRSASDEQAKHGGTDARLARALLDLDLDSLAPVEALMKLYELRRVAAESREAEKPSEEVRAVRRA